MYKIRTAKEIFEEELSGEPLEESVVILAIQIAQREMYRYFHEMINDNNSQLLYLKDEIKLNEK